MVAAISFSSRAFTADSDSNSNLQTLMTRPLIVGASVSAASDSPGKLLARRMGALEILSSAVPGASSRTTIPNPIPTDESSNWSRASIVIGVDLFFWDTRDEPSQALANLDRLNEWSKKTGKEVVVGNVPVFSSLLVRQLIGQKAESVEAINQKLESIHQENPKFHVLDLRALYVKYGDRPDAFSDGLHPTSKGDEFISGELEKLIRLEAQADRSSSLVTVVLATERLDRFFKIKR